MRTVVGTTTDSWSSLFACLKKTTWVLARNTLSGKKLYFEVFLTTDIAMKLL